MLNRLYEIKKDFPVKTNNKIVLTKCLSLELVNKILLNATVTVLRYTLEVYCDMLCHVDFFSHRAFFVKRSASYV